MRVNAGLLASICLAVLLGLPHAVHAEEPIGRDEYMKHCAVCHGEDGKGDGPLAQSMTVALPDLTKIEERRGGTFPMKEIYQIIDGRKMLRGHGTSDMPVWGDRYSFETYEETGPYGMQDIVRGRILSLVFYLYEIQE